MSTWHESVLNALRRFVHGHPGPYSWVAALEPDDQDDDEDGGLPDETEDATFTDEDIFAATYATDWMREELRK